MAYTPQRTQTCIGCSVFIDQMASSGLCKKCYGKHKSAEWREKHPDYYQTTERRAAAREATRKSALAKGSRHRYDRALRYKFGFGVDKYDEMLLAQKGQCAICQSADPGENREFFCVDHDHTTNRVRGLLCQGCNKALGLLKDDPNRLRAAMEYLCATPV